MPLSITLKLCYPFVKLLYNHLPVRGARRGEVNGGRQPVHEGISRKNIMAKIKIEYETQKNNVLEICFTLGGVINSVYEFLSGVELFDSYGLLS